MENDLRSNPRFVSSKGIPATVFAEGRLLSGTILDFSSTGFAVVVADDVGESNVTQIEVVFAAEGSRKELKLSALITNKRAEDATSTRLGCRISDMHNLANEYFAFLTIILGKQGLLRSMATKPKKSMNPVAI